MAAVLVPDRTFEPAGRLQVSAHDQDGARSRLAKCRELANHAAQGGRGRPGTKSNGKEFTMTSRETGGGNHEENPADRRARLCRKYYRPDGHGRRVLCGPR